LNPRGSSVVAALNYSDFKKKITGLDKTHPLRKPFDTPSLNDKLERCSNLTYLSSVSSQVENRAYICISISNKDIAHAIKNHLPLLADLLAAAKDSGRRPESPAHDGN
jgi:hypothetical protein